MKELTVLPVFVKPLTKAVFFPLFQAVAPTAVAPIAASPAGVNDAAARPTPVAPNPATFFVASHAFCACFPTTAISPSLPPIPPLVSILIPRTSPIRLGTCFANINIPTIKNALKTNVQSFSPNSFVKFDKLEIKNK